MKSYCKQNNMNKIRWSALMSVLVFMTFQGLAQQDVDDENTPLPENEIVCFAAKKKWVCAPKDESEKAHEKAMQIVANDEPEEIQSLSDSNVQIQTMRFNDEIKPINNQTVNNPPTQQAVIQEQIKDFTPREDVVDEQPDAVESDVSKASPEPTSNTLSEAEVKQVSPTSSTRDRTVDNSFNQWQNEFPDSWSFQVIGTSNRHHINDFINTNGLANYPHAVVKTQANGADWWVVLAGLFESRDAAISKRQELPSQLATNAWVRQIKTIVGVAD